MHLVTVWASQKRRRTERGGKETEAEADRNRQTQRKKETDRETDRQTETERDEKKKKKKMPSTMIIYYEQQTQDSNDPHDASLYTEVRNMITSGNQICG